MVELRLTLGLESGMTCTSHSCLAHRLSVLTIPLLIKAVFCFQSLDALHNNRDSIKINLCVLITILIEDKNQLIFNF